MNDQSSTLSQVQQIRLLARDEANTLLLSHLNQCPLIISNIETRTRKLETSFAKLSGFMVGSGLLGGLSGAGLSSFFN